MPRPNDSLTSLEQSLAGRYTFEHELGRGGTAIVWSVRDEKHDRRVALKILKPELAEAVGPERFQREIRTAARLQHPHIATVYDSGNDDGVLWFSMPQVVGGSTLREYATARGALPLADVQRLAREIGQALQYAHDHGVLHRDVKPENVLLTEDGSALVTDFGLARAMGEDDTRLTESGIAVGTPAYMSPEQVRGSMEIDGRSDQYSLACTLYELLAGERPFRGGQGLAFVARRLMEPAPDIQSVRADVPDDAAQALRRAMAVDVDERFPTVRDFVAAFTGAVPSGATSLPRGFTSAPSGPTGSPVAHGLSRSARTAVLATVAAVLAVVAGVVWMRFKGSESLTPARIALAVLPFEHVGDSTTAYFADGLTSEIRTRLGSLPELQVLASGSSNQYRTINASLVEVGRELGVRYLLMGKVRSSVDSAGVRQLKVSPELVDTRTGGGTSAWTSSYQVTPTDVFAVQGEIAQRVAEAMGVALGASRKAELATLPTRNMAAYDAFLRAEAISQQRSVRDPATLRRAFEAYREAARLDSTFLLAVARGVNVGSTLWFNRPPDGALADTLRAMVQQAMALDPRSPATLSALGDFQLLVRQDQEQALSALAAGLRASPDDPALLNSAATADRVVGRWADSRARLERLIVLDPRSPVAWNNLGRTLLWTREYSAARAAFERALALAPANLGVRQHLTMHWLAQGRLDSARAVIRGAPATVTREALVAFFGTYWDLAWVLEPADLRLLTSLRPDRFDGDLGNWGLVLGQAYHALGDTVRARIYADSGAAAILARRDKAPDDWQQRMLRGLALAYAGHHDEAIAEGERAVAMKPLARDATFGAYALFTLARIYGFVGEPQKARAAVDRVLAVPMFVTKEWMTLDPAFRGVR